MKILHITAIGGGGAGIACTRQHKMLCESGVNSKVLFLLGSVNPQKNYFSVETTDPDFAKTMRRYKRERALLNVKVRLNGKTPELFSAATSPWKIEDHPLVREADIIHLHWVAGMIDLERFFGVVKKPIVWTLHDAWPYSGGFHYERYWDSSRFSKLSAPGVELRKRLFSGRKLHLISPSEYLLNESRKSGVFEASEFHHIRYCIDSWFLRNPDEKTSPKIKKWLFCADELDYKRKGATLLFEAFSQWKNPNVKLIVAGKAGKLKLPGDERIEFIGHQPLMKIMCTTQGVIHPSLEDNQPNVIIEAQCTGNPVLATPAGGVSEMIDHGKNGFLTKDFSVESLMKGFDELDAMQIDHDAISKAAGELYSPKHFLEKIKAVYAGC